MTNTSEDFSLNDPFAIRTRGRICVAVASPTAKEAIEVARGTEPLAEVIEIRLDAMVKPEVAPLIKALNRPLLFTNRPAWEGGAFTGSEEQRIKPLLTAVRAGATYVDLELRAEPALRRQLFREIERESPDTMLILSWHDFNTTPDTEELEKIFARLCRSGAQVGKIVTMAHDYQDAQRVLALQELSMEWEFPLISFAMGRAGMLSRLATLERGGYMTYAAPDSVPGTAPGQLRLSELYSLLGKDVAL
ncbi:MAG: type I 3-dehydroquinate dehydratase [Desulfobacterales bacterium]|nr:type I 3-dehydroquinate dehydratase [Desulfobacterales bacterium]